MGGHISMGSKGPVNLNRFTPPKMISPGALVRDGTWKGTKKGLTEIIPLPAQSYAKYGGGHEA